MTEIPFTKLHGLGNDFVLLDLREKSAASKMSRAVESKTFLRSISNRKTGVGCDQVLVLKAKNKLRIYNADGSAAEMCGNGLRATALYIWSRSKAKKKERFADLNISTQTGSLICRMLDSNQNRIETEIGCPKVKAAPKSLGHVLGGHTHAQFICVDVGNPHLVVFGVWPNSVEELTDLGSALENHRAFPNRTNVEFVRARGKNTIEVQVWERGVGRTEACGTGAVAAVVAASQRALVSLKSSVLFSGGEATVRLVQVKDQPLRAFLTGTAHEVFSSTFYWP